MSEHKSRFLVKQRAFLKIYLIYMAEKDELYGLEHLTKIKDAFKNYGYKPVHSEIYKSLHELQADGILNRAEVKKKEDGMQKVIYYRIKDPEKAKLYRKQLKVELDRCYGMLGKAIADIYS